MTTPFSLGYSRHSPFWPSLWPASAAARATGSAAALGALVHDPHPVKLDVFLVVVGDGFNVAAGEVSEGAHSILLLGRGRQAPRPRGLPRPTAAGPASPLTHVLPPA